MKRLSLAASMLALTACQTPISGSASTTAIYDLPPRLTRIVEIAHDPANPYILIEAHRGSLGHDRPENSIPAIEHAIEIGVDWVEIDVALASDGGLVLMHDNTLDRTTTLTGPVGDYTLAEIMAANLRRDTDGTFTDLHPASLRQALETMDGRIHFRLDLKCKDVCIEAVYDLVEEMGLMDQAVVGGRSHERALAMGLTDEQLITVGAVIGEIGAPENLPGFVDYIQVKDFDAANPPLDLMAAFAPHVRMVAFPYDDRRSGGRGDVLSATDPDAGWGWLARAGADVMLTDESEAIIAYLEANGFREFGETGAN